MSETTLLDLNDVLDQNVDDVEDVPEFITPPEGSYVLSVADAKAESYKTTNKDGQEEERVRIKVIYSVVETKQLADDDEQPVPVGSLFSEQFMTNNDGMSFFKRQAKNILGEDNIKGVKIGDILKELSNGHVFNADVKVKENKGKGQNSDKVYRNVQVRIKPSNTAELSDA